MPTAFYDSNFRFYFFSREEERRHVHVSSTQGEAKIWLEPEVIIAKRIHVSDEEATKMLKIVKKRKEELINAWNEHFAKK